MHPPSGNAVPLPREYRTAACPATAVADAETRAIESLSVLVPWDEVLPPRARGAAWRGQEGLNPTARDHPRSSASRPSATSRRWGSR